jgi:pimeloyl-ACP methyl ester carboxylesterase
VTELIASPAPYRPTRPPPLATLREFRLTFSSARLALMRLPEPPEGGGGPLGPVLAIPALFCADWQTRILRAALSRAGYAAFGWGLGTNWGPTPRLMDGVEARLLALSAAHGPVNLIGLSMGGLFCRWLAARHPACVRQVITVCSPFRAPLDSFWLPLRPAVRIWRVPGLAAMAESLERPLPVPCTCLYSKRDGIVAWRSCFEPSHPEDSLGIAGSHVTIGSDPSVTAIVLDRFGRAQAAPA